jgi:sterol desaturase/sphingolipid hydroxylase (fatty acid hydroxylase superfamily)
MLRRVIGATVALAVLALVFCVLERRWRARPAKSGADLRTDLFYWFLTPLVSRPLAQLGSFLVALPVLWLAGQSLSRQALLQGHGPAAQWPYWLQAVLVMGDFVGYWTHRAFHRGRLWRFHAVHHSSVTLDWLSSVRVHPVNDLLTRMVQALPSSPAASRSWCWPPTCRS